MSRRSTTRRLLTTAGLGVIVAVSAATLTPAGPASATPRAATTSTTKLPGHHYAYIPDLAGSDETTVDLTSHTVTGSVPVGDHPLISRTTKDGSKTYVDNLGVQPGKLTVIDNRTGTRKDIVLDSIPFAIVLSPDDRELYVVSPNLTVDVVDTAADTVTRKFPIPGPDISAGLEISPDGRTLYLSTVAGKLLAIDSSTGKQVEPTIDCGGVLPAWLGISRDGTRLYSLNWFSDDTTVFDTRTWKQIADIPDGDGAKPAIMKESPDGRKLYISNYAGKNIQIVDTTTWKTLGRIPTQGLAMGIDFGPDGTGYITDWGPGSSTYGNPFVATGFFVAAFLGAPQLADPGPGDLTAFDPATDKVLWSIPVGHGASVMSFST